ncbi:MAG: nucleotidyltransferase domain-containing protein [Alkalispirochaeta sp.]
MLDQSAIDQLRRLIFSVVVPRQIILFGTQATGRVSEDSDIDVLIVVGDDTADLRHLRQSLHIQISASVSLPCDVLVERESTFAQRSELPTLERSIKETGTTLYAA